MEKKLDLIIVGLGPSGYCASIYASRYKMDHILIGSLPGGTVSSAHKICNYPGLQDISGIDLMVKMRKHALSYGVEEVMGKVIEVKKEDKGFKVFLENGDTFESKSVLISTGTKRRNLGLPSEKKFEGKGISYCSTCDGAFYKEKVVGVVGGSNAATMSAIYLSDIAKKVFVIYRGPELKGDRLWIDEVLKKSNVELILNANIVEFVGDGFLNSVKLDIDNRVVDLDGVFLEIGSVPSLDFKIDIAVNDRGYISVDSSQKTSVDGLYASGDITDSSNGFQQIVTSCSEGAIASNSIYYYLKSL